MDYAKLFNIDDIQRQYNIKSVMPPHIVEIKTSPKRTKKYMITLLDQNNNTHNIHFGDIRYQQYRDKLEKYLYLNHYNPDRRKMYLARTSKIRDRNGNYTVNDPFSANYYSARVLW